ncbi:glycosyltransferase family 4 protein [Escherichia coli]|uniref:glycosyltransferase family 4 protein n=1 Tax=Escherichia coli TaxID=562 RepID=UPI0018123D40|nr:glycosyltransferase family 4 protein [Escherichia coli]
MNILYTESSPNIGGQELQAVAQMRMLRHKGHRVLLACRKNSLIAEEAQKYSIDIEYISFRNSLHWPSVCAATHLVSEFRPDFVVCHSGHDHNIIALTRALIIFSRKTFFIIRQKTYTTQKMKVFSLNNFCDAIIVPSKKIKNALYHAGCRRLINVVYPGFYFDEIDHDLSLPVPEKIDLWLKHRTRAPVIVQAGMLRPEKGHEFMLNVLFQLKKRGLLFYWLIVGNEEGNKENRLQDAIDALDMGDCVMMCGHVSPIFPVYRKASLLVAPSRNESFGMVVAEAAACGIPVMASNVGGIPEIIQHGQNGVLLPPEDCQAWLEALNEFFYYPERYAEMAKKARQDVRNRFDIEVTVDRLLDIGKQGLYFSK